MSRPRWSAQGFDLPLLIGGATTSRVHTAVKIHPNYRRGQAVYVIDASRAVGVASVADVGRRSARPTSPSMRDEYAQDRRGACARAGGQAAAAARRRARQCAASSTGRRYAPPKPSFLGTRVFDDYPIAELVDYIDWTPFFQTWELSGKLSRRSSTTTKVGEAARSLFDDAQAC